MSNSDLPPSLAHSLALIDESSETVLAICKCGARFLAITPDAREARYLHAKHRYDAITLDDKGRDPIEPKRPEVIDPATHFEDGRKRRTPKAEMGAIALQALPFIEAGESPETVAPRLGVSPSGLRQRLALLRAEQAGEAA